MGFKWIFVFAFFGLALNLLIIGATGRVNDFWSGRRGSGRIVADLKSPSARLAFSGAAAVFLTIAIFLAIHLLGELQGTSHP
jgi:hypothetical protein